MSRTRVVTLGFLLVILSATAALAQRGYVFTEFNCVPTSCEETGPLETSSIAAVIYDVKCSHNGEINEAWGGQVLVEVLNCAIPHRPHALVKRLSVDLLDDFGQL